MEAVNYYHKSLHLGCCSSPRSVSEDDLLYDTKDIMKKIDDLPLHPKKMLIYQRYVLSKLSWNLTIADIDIIWVEQSRDSIVNQYVKIPVADTLDVIQLPKRKFGICYVMVSTRFIKCQAAIRNNLRKSLNNDVVRSYYDMNCDTNLQYDYFKSNKDVITQYRKNKEDRITTVLTTQSLAIKWLWEHGVKSAAKIWPKSISKLPKNNYVNNFLANASNKHKWGNTTSPLCLHCNENRTLGHMVVGCETSLRKKRNNYCHDSTLSNLGRMLESIKSIGIYKDIPGHIITPCYDYWRKSKT